MERIRKIGLSHSLNFFILNEKLSVSPDFFPIHRNHHIKAMHSTVTRMSYYIKHAGWKIVAETGEKERKS
jgi:hypothetical protein